MIKRKQAKEIYDYQAGPTEDNRIFWYWEKEN